MRRERISDYEWEQRNRTMVPTKRLSHRELLEPEERRSNVEGALRERGDLGSRTFPRHDFSKVHVVLYTLPVTVDEFREIQTSIKSAYESIRSEVPSSGRGTMTTGAFTNYIAFFDEVAADLFRREVDSIFRREGLPNSTHTQSGPYKFVEGVGAQENIEKVLEEIGTPGPMSNGMYAEPAEGSGGYLP